MRPKFGEDRSSEPLRSELSGSSITVIQNDCELLTSIARRAFIPSSSGGQDRRKSHENLVSSLVTETVVQRLEVVNVEQQ
jgi:hypothetical protein